MSVSTYTPCIQCRKLNRIPISRDGSSSRVPVCGSCRKDLPIRGDVNELSAAELSLLVAKSPLPVVTDFWAPWCGPCKVFAPTFEQAARELVGQFVFAKVNTEAHPLASGTYTIRGIPTLILFQGGLEVRRLSGALSLPQLRQWLQEAGAASSRNHAS